MTNKSGIPAKSRLRSSPAAGERRAMMKAMMKVVLKVCAGVAMAEGIWFFAKPCEK
jgi:2-phospho-L-lactate guanylyltransferase (CobY/MobA/RfbA family)